MKHTILESDRVSRADSIFGQNSKQPLMLGIFALNGTGSAGINTLASSYEMTWDHSVKVAKMADELGLELFMPLTRWVGFGGESNYAGDTFETLTYMAGIAAHTERLMTVVTMHVPFLHPTYAAKAIATLDHISNGRAGINMVLGWLKPEMGMFGLTPMSTEDRYEYGSEWLKIIRRLWNEYEPFDHQGRFFEINGLISNPKPIQKDPVIVSAAMSDAGIQFACNEADLTFSSFQSHDHLAEHTQKLRSLAEKGGRDVGVVSLSLIICRETEEEAKAYYEQLRDKIDYVAAENFARASGANIDTMDAEARTAYLQKLALTPGNAIVVGNPEQVADQIEQLHACGVSSLFIGFHDYFAELPFFAERVLPILEARGVRHPFNP